MVVDGLATRVARVAEGADEGFLVVAVAAATAATRDFGVGSGSGLWSGVLRVLVGSSEPEFHCWWRLGACGGGVDWLGG